MWIIYSNYGQMQGLILNTNGVWKEVSIMTTGIGQDPIARFNTKEEAEAKTDDHYSYVVKVKAAFKISDRMGEIE